MAAIFASVAISGCSGGIQALSEPEQSVTSTVSEGDSPKATKYEMHEAFSVIPLSKGGIAQDALQRILPVSKPCSGQCFHPPDFCMVSQASMALWSSILRMTGDHRRVKAWIQQRPTARAALACRF